MGEGWRESSPDPVVAREKGALVETLSAQPNGDFIIALAGIRAWGPAGNAVDDRRARREMWKSWAPRSNSGHGDHEGPRFQSALATITNAEGRLRYAHEKTTSTPTSCSGGWCGCGCAPFR